MLERAERIARYTRGLTESQFAADQMIFDAVVQCLLIIGEAANNVPQSFRDQEPSKPRLEAAAGHHEHGQPIPSERVRRRYLKLFTPSLICTRLEVETSMIEFDGRVALITGAGRGLGLAYAKLLAARGAKVILHDIGAKPDGTGVDPSIAEAAAAALRKAGMSVSAASGPIDTRDGCQRLVAEAVETSGHLDILIHNAGWVAYQPIADLKDCFLTRMIALGIEAPLWLSQAAWPLMMARRYGRILLTTSDRALYPEYAQEGLAAYAATRMATVGIANTLALEGAPHGIVVNSISPVAKTRMWGVEGEPDELRPDAVAPGAAFLVSEACAEGGWVLRASNGQFHAVKGREAAGVVYPRDLRAVTATSMEEIAASWDRIAASTLEART